MTLYPFKFQTIYKDKLWGGQKIKTILGKDFGSLPNCGETWEISGVEGDISQVSNGELKGTDLKTLIQKFKADLVGTKPFQQFGDDFPLLVKFIDANDDLSIQVHPDDALAKKRHNGFGKTEMWYILQADAGAKLISGFNRKTNPPEYLAYFQKGQLMDLLQEVEVAKDDVFFLPAGRVHTIGKGLLLAEIQQTSDITYRIYDFDRTDADGNKRELHVEEALAALDFDSYDPAKLAYDSAIDQPVDLVACPYFSTRRLHFTQTTKRDYRDLDSFVILVCMEGQAIVKYEESSEKISKGECMLIPAATSSIILETDTGFNMLESFIA